MWEQEEDEEARIQEAKADSLRKLKQKVGVNWHSLAEKEPPQQSKKVSSWSGYPQCWIVAHTREKSLNLPPMTIVS